MGCSSSLPEPHITYQNDFSKVSDDHINIIKKDIGLFVLLTLRKDKDSYSRSYRGSHTHTIILPRYKHLVDGLNSSSGRVVERLVVPLLELIKSKDVLYKELNESLKAMLKAYDVKNYFINHDGRDDRYYRVISHYEGLENVITDDVLENWTERYGVTVNKDTKTIYIYGGTVFYITEIFNCEKQQTQQTEETQQQSDPI